MMKTWLVGLAALVLAVGACGGDKQPVGSDASTDGSDAGPTCSPPPPDADGDGISNADEGVQQSRDTDSDGTPDYEDTDSDDDGIPDAQEAGDENLCTPPRDTDDDGASDSVETDADANGIPDADEPDQDLDGDGWKDFQDLDDDGDNLYDTEEWGDGPEPVDFDDDGTPDYQDTDSDDDTIPDLKEGLLDIDGDGVPAFHDDDSDGDCIPDSIEAGPNPESPLDSDADGQFDFLDIDADNDGLLDEQEDLNCNGALDAGESSTTLTDTDSDGFPDVVEWAAGTDPNDNTSVLDPDDFYFVLPYFDPEEQDDLDFQTSIIKADVQLSMDTTGSMGGTVTELQNTLSSLIIPQTALEVPDVAFGASTFEDFPVSPFGSQNTHPEIPSFPHDLPFRLYQRVTTVVADAQAGVNAFQLGIGGDGEESGLVSLYQIATGEGMSWTVATAGSVPKFNPMVGFDEAKGHGVLGGVGFRVGALPIVVHITDIEWHEAADYWGAGIPEAPTRDATVAALLGLGARVIGITSSSTARVQLEQMARETSAVVPPTAWGPTETLCHTGAGGGLLPPDATGLCPLVFTMDFGGTGVSTALVDGIKALVTFGTIDINALPVADPSELPEVDTSLFITAVDPVPPAPPGATIMGDAFKDVQPGQPVRFRVHARNTIVQHKREAQLFKVTIRVMGDGVTTLDERDVFIIVPGGGIDP